MQRERIQTETGAQRDERVPIPGRKPWHAPQVILSEVFETNAGSKANTDAPLVSPTC